MGISENKEQLNRDSRTIKNHFKINDPDAEYILLVRRHDKYMVNALGHAGKEADDLSRTFKDDFMEGLLQRTYEAVKNDLA